MRRPLVQTASGQDDDAGWNRTSERTKIFAGHTAPDDEEKTLHAAASCKEPKLRNLDLCYPTLCGGGYVENVSQISRLGGHHQPAAVLQVGLE